MQVSFELDLTLYQINRDIYSILDWIGDLGGLYEGLHLMCKAGMFFAMFKDFEHYLIERLYRMTNDNQVVYKSSNIPSSQGTFRYSETSWLRQKCLNLRCLRKCLCCQVCRLSRQERLLKKARK